MACACSKRISGSRFQKKGYNGILESVGRGVAAFTGFSAGELLTNVVLKDQKADNRGIIGVGKVGVSHLVAPLLLPDSIMDNDYVQGGLDGFGVSGIKDILITFSKDFATKLGISGVDYGYSARRLQMTTTSRSTDGGGNEVKADLQ